MGIQSFIETVCVQDAILWSYAGNDEYGQPSFDAPTQVKVRWEHDQRTVIDEFGKQYESVAEILIPVDIKRLDYIALGTVDSSTPDDPQEYDEAYQVIRFTKIPMIKSQTEFVRKAYVGWQR